jgi:hypothetical protein
LSSYNDNEPPAASLAYPPRQTDSSTTNARRLVLRSILALFAIAVVATALVGTQVKDSVTRTIERVGRSITLQGQLSAQWFKAKTDKQ